MRLHIIALALQAIAWLGFALTPAMAMDGAAATAPATRPASVHASGITLAVLDFEAGSPGNPELGKQVAEVLSVGLSGVGNFTIVDRASLPKVLEEQGLTLSGAVSSDQAIKIGKLVGARILITGKIFPMGEQMFLTAKIIGTETTLVEGVLVSGKTTGDVSQLIAMLIERVSQRLEQKATQLVAGDEAGLDPLPVLRRTLANRSRPVVAVMISERHVAERPAAPGHPAVQTEIRKMLLACGFQVIDVPQTAAGSPAGVDLLVTGESFSEFAARIGQLVSCRARAEFKVVRVRDGQTLLADHVAAQAVDLAENSAAKGALEKAGHALGLKLLEHFAATLPAAEQAGR